MNAKILLQLDFNNINHSQKYKNMTESDIKTLKYLDEKLNGCQTNQSPVSLSTALLPHEAFACSGFGVQKDFEFEDKI